MATQAPPYDDDDAGRVDATYDGMGKQACFGADARSDDDGDKVESGPRPTTQTAPVQKVQYEVGESSKANEVDGQETAREPKPVRSANRTRRSSRSAPKSREMSRTAQWLKELFQAPKPDKPAVQRNKLKKKRRVEKQVDGSATRVDKSAEVSTPGAQSVKGHVEEPVTGASTPGTVSTRGVASSSRAGGSTRGLETSKEAAPVDAAVSSDRGLFGSNKGTEAAPSESKGAETTTDRGWFFGESAPEPTESKGATTTSESKDATPTTTTEPKDATTTTTTDPKDTATTTNTESKSATPSTTDAAPQDPVGSASSPTDSKNATPTTAESTRSLFGSDAAPEVPADSTPMPTEPKDATTTGRGLLGSKTDDSPEDKDTSTDKADDPSVPDGVREGVEEAIEKIEQILQVILDYLSSMGRPALTDRVSQQLRAYLDNVEKATRGLPIDNEEKARGLPTDNGTVASKAGSVGTRDLVSKAGSVGTRDLSAESDRMVPKIQPDVDGPSRESVPGIELGEGGSGWFGGPSHGAESVGILQEPGSSREVPLTPGFVPMSPEQGPGGYPAEGQGGRYSEGRSDNGVPLASHDEARGFEGHETDTDGYTDDSDSEFDGEQILVRLSDCMSPIGTEVLRRWMQDRLEQALEENVGVDEMVVDEEGLLSWGDAEIGETDGETDEGQF